MKDLPTSTTALAARLTGASTDPRVSPRELVECARAHRVHLVLAGILDADDPSDAALVAALRDEYREAAARDAAATAALTRLLQTASTHGARPLVVKGAALAHRIYARSWERPRGDTDLFIVDDDVARMRRALEAAGYQRAVAVDGELVTRQFQYSRGLAGGIEHHVDVHMRMFNPAVFADALEWVGADERAVALPQLGPAARTISDADALFVACLHRVAHHQAAPDLIWLYDIDRLARRLESADWMLFIALARRARVRAVCRSSLTLAAYWFETPVAAGVLTSLDTPGPEPSCVFLERKEGELRVQWLNLRHLGTWRARAALVRQHLLPTGSYVLQKYGRRGRGWLPLLYAYRIVTGAPRWLRGR